MVAVRANHQRDIWVSTAPFSGIGVGRTTSKALMRSVATISRVPSPRSKVSRTLPRRKTVKPSATALVNVGIS
jgi:hypothetical protein